MSNKSIRLKLDGKPLSFETIPPCVDGIVRLLDQSPIDELFSTEELAKRLSFRYDTVRAYGSHERLIPYSSRVRDKRLWGNPKAIETLRRQLEAM